MYTNLQCFPFVHVQNSNLAGANLCSMTCFIFHYSFFILHSSFLFSTLAAPDCYSLLKITATQTTKTHSLHKIVQKAMVEKQKNCIFAKISILNISINAVFFLNNLFQQLATKLFQTS